MKSFDKYGEYYDLLYRDKDYDGEYAFIEQILQQFSPRQVRTLLDAGCGTGGHAIPLAKGGYEVTGIDLSETMLDRARRKAEEQGLNLSLHVADLRHLALNRVFDACVCMFAVLGYLPQNRDIQQALTSIRAHLREGSLFIFDCWNGLAVLP